MIPFRNVFTLLVFIFGAVFLQTADAQNTDSLPAALDCVFRENSGIFSPQQSIIIDLTLRFPHDAADNSSAWSLNAVLTDISKPDHPVVTQFNTQIVPHTPLPVSFITPDKEGVYEIVLRAVQETKPNRQVFRVAISRPAAPLTVEVRRQFVVIPNKTAPRSAGDWILKDTRELSLSSESPAHRFMPNLPSFSKVADLPKISDFPKPGKLISELPRPAELLRLPQLGKRNDSENISHVAPVVNPPPFGRSVQLPVFQEHFFLETSQRHPEFSALAPVENGGCTYHLLEMETEAGKPYLVEIDYPTDVPQTLGIAIVDDLHTNGQHGTWGTLNTAADIYVAKEIVQDSSSETIATHRLLFWAAEGSPLLLLTNRQRDQEALFRNIRISRITPPEHPEDQRLPKLFEGQAQRRRIGQILEAEGFKQLSGVEQLANWQEAYEGCSRLLDILSRGGYDGVTLTVLSKDVALYPKGNESLNSLEMMFRRFNSEGLVLIPAIEFNFLIPSLEQLLMQYPGITEEMLIADSQIRRYNILYPAVQEAMAGIVQDLADRFGHHPSFGGVAVVLSPESYAGLPFTPRPPDDYTFLQFQNEAGQELGIPFPSVEKFSQTMPIQQFLEKKNTERIRFLQSNPQVWETWVRWRAAKVSGFYANLAKKVSTKRTDASLFLLGGTVLDQPEIQQFCTPTLPRNHTSLQALQLLGFELPVLSKIDSLHFLRPVPISSTRNYCYDRLGSIDTLPHFSDSGTLPGVQFVHTETDYFLTTPVHHQSRRHFVKQLAQADILMFMESGTSLPFGQESAMFDLLDTYRRLPNTAFQTFQSSEEKAALQPTASQKPASLQPLTVRYKNLPEGMIMYIVNDAPFAVEADFSFSADFRSTLTELSGRRIIRSLSRGPNQQAGSPSWRASLLPYDLLAIRISDANAKIESVSVLRPPAFCGSEGFFKQQVEELSQRVHAARNALPTEGLKNAGFELPGDDGGAITGWQCYGKTLTVQQDHMMAGKEQYSVKLTNNSTESGTFLSEPLNAPVTGRLGVSMLVGIPAEGTSLPMNVILTAKHRGEPFSRSVPVGETLMPYFANVEPKNGVRWSQLLVPFERERLPMDSLEEVRIGVQYRGNGTVWLDDVKVYPVLFSTNETRELQIMLVAAYQRCSSDRFSDLLSQLEGHWTQFLFQHVPVPLPQPKLAEVKPQIVNKTDPPPKHTLYQRAKGWFGLGK